MDHSRSNSCGITRSSVGGNCQNSCPSNRLPYPGQTSNFHACVTRCSCQQTSLLPIGHSSTSTSHLPQVTKAYHYCANDRLKLDQSSDLMRSYHLKTCGCRVYHGMLSDESRGQKSGGGSVCLHKQFCCHEKHSNSGIMNDVGWNSTRASPASLDTLYGSDVDRPDSNNSVHNSESGNHYHGYCLYENHIVGHKSSDVQRPSVFYRDHISPRNPMRPTNCECMADNIIVPRHRFNLDAEVQVNFAEISKENHETSTFVPAPAKTSKDQSVVCRNSEVNEADFSNDVETIPTGQGVASSCNRLQNVSHHEPSSDEDDRPLPTTGKSLETVHYVSVIHYAGQPNVDCISDTLRGCNDRSPNYSSSTPTMERTSTCIRMIVDLNNNLGSQDSTKNYFSSTIREPRSSLNFLPISGKFADIKSYKRSLSSFISKDGFINQIKTLCYTSTLYYFYLLPVKFYKFPCSVSPLPMQPIISSCINLKANFLKQSQEHCSRSNFADGVLKSVCCLELQTYEFQSTHGIPHEAETKTEALRATIGIYLVKPISARRALNRAKFQNLFKAEPLWVGSDLKLFFIKLESEQDLISNCKHGIFAIKSITYWHDHVSSDCENYQVKCVEQDKSLKLLFTKVCVGPNSHPNNSAQFKKIKNNLLLASSGCDNIFKNFDDLSDKDKKNTMLLMTRKNGFENVGQEPIQIILDKLNIQGYPFLVSSELSSDTVKETSNNISEAPEMIGFSGSVLDVKNLKPEYKVSKDRKQMNKTRLEMEDIIDDRTQEVNPFTPDEITNLNAQPFNYQEKTYDNFSQEKVPLVVLCDELKKALKNIGGQSQSILRNTCHTILKIIQNAQGTVTKDFFCLKTVLNDWEYQFIENLCKKSCVDVYDIIQIYLKSRSNCKGVFKNSAEFRSMKRQILKQTKVFPRLERVRINQNRKTLLHKIFAISYQLMPSALHVDHLKNVSSEIFRDGFTVKKIASESLSEKSPVLQQSEAITQERRQECKGLMTLQNESVLMPRLEVSSNCSAVEHAYENPPELQVEVINAWSDCSAHNIPFKSDFRDINILAGTDHEGNVVGALSNSDTCSFEVPFGDLYEENAPSKSSIGNTEILTENTHEENLLNVLSDRNRDESNIKNPTENFYGENETNVPSKPDNCDLQVKAQDSCEENVSDILLKTDEHDINSVTDNVHEENLSNTPSKTSVFCNRNCYENMSEENVPKEVSEEYLQINYVSKSTANSRSERFDDPIVKEYIWSKRAASKVYKSQKRGRRFASNRRKYAVPNLFTKQKNSPLAANEFHMNKTLSVDEYLKRKVHKERHLGQHFNKYYKSFRPSEPDFTHTRSDNNNKLMMDREKTWVGLDQQMPARKCKYCLQSPSMHSRKGKCIKMSSSLGRHKNEINNSKISQDNIRTYIDPDCFEDIASSAMTREDEDALERVVAERGVYVYLPKKPAPQDPRPHRYRFLNEHSSSVANCQGDLLSLPTQKSISCISKSQVQAIGQSSSDDRKDTNLDCSLPAPPQSGACKHCDGEQSLSISSYPFGFVPSSGVASTSSKTCLTKNDASMSDLVMKYNEKCLEYLAKMELTRNTSYKPNVNTDCNQRGLPHPKSSLSITCFDNVRPPTKCIRNHCSSSGYNEESVEDVPLIASITAPTQENKKRGRNEAYFSEPLADSENYIVEKKRRVEDKGVTSESPASTISCDNELHIQTEAKKDLTPSFDKPYSPSSPASTITLE